MSKPGKGRRDAPKGLFKRAKTRYRSAGRAERAAWLAGVALCAPVVVPLYFGARMRKVARQGGRPLFVAPSKPPPPVAPDRVVEERLAAEADTFALVRIIGNDLPPRHSIGQSRENLDFVLRNEPEFDGCQKLWIVNRIVNKTEEARLIARLDAAGADYEVIPFVAEDYAQVPFDFSPFEQDQVLQSEAFHALDEVRKARAVAQIHRLRNGYVMHNNGARNRAIELGRSRAKWILPFDGNGFMTSADWRRLRDDVTADPERQYMVVPMARLGTNEGALDDISPEDAHEEPQIMFRRDAPERFDEAHPYGRRPKVEMLARLGVRGPWNTWPMEPWDLAGRPVGPGFHRTGRAGLVRRLASGRSDLETAHRTVSRLRGVARADAIVETLLRADEAVLAERGGPVDGPLFFTPECLAEAPKETASAIAGAAAKAMARGPYSVTHKPESPAGVGPHDYYHPAPYWHPDPRKENGLPYVRRDGVRLPGTVLYGEGSERFDRTRWQMMCDDTLACALEWSISGDEAAREHALRLVRTWFVDPETAMTPHLRFAQVRLGHDGGEGKGTGILEFKDLAFLLDAVRLLRDPGVSDAMRDWLEAYVEWLDTSPQGAQERRAPNNHGVYFDLQYAAIAAFLGRTAEISKCWMYSASRLRGHFDGQGAQPHELRRTLTKHYCAYNLQGWLSLLHVYRSCGLSVDAQPETARVRRGVEWFLAHRGRAWPFEQIAPFDEDRFVPLAQAAAALGYADAPGPLDRALLGDKACFDPNDGIPPYWPLILASKGRSFP